MALLEVSHLRKAYGGAVALRDASLTVEAGETLALMGENGAGKSTLIKILAGAVAPDGGEIRLDGRAARFASPGDAHRQGLRFIHQELNVAPAMSVAENIFLGRDYPTRFGLIDWRALHTRARAGLEALGVTHIAPETRLSRLSVGDRMLTKIAAAFLDDAQAPARLFVMDEPTAALAGAESQRLFGVIGELKRRGCGIIYVSHRLDEVLTLADRIAVLRDGESRATLTAQDATKAALIEAMTGRGSFESATTAGAPGRVLLSASGLTAPGLRDVCFELRAGEILGCVGLAGAGHEQLLNALVGGATAGQIAIDGAPRRLREPADAWRHGLALAPRERRAEGLLLMQDIAANVALPHLRRLARLATFLNRRAETKQAVEMGARVRLKSTGPRQKTRQLSGGNQQKVMFARAVSGSPLALLLDEPTRGVDVGAKFDIYTLLHELAASGVAALAISSDHEEILALCTRIAIFRDGRLVETLANAGLTTQSLLQACYGER
jgi:ABC-type sugar transport system ATPase subunit